MKRLLAHVGPIAYVLARYGHDGIRFHLTGPDEDAAEHAAKWLGEQGAIVSSSIGARPQKATEALLQADLVIALPGWDGDPRARVDVVTSYGAGIPAVELRDLCCDHTHTPPFE